MSLEIYLIVMLLTLASIYYVLPLALTTFRRYRGERIVNCPETRTPCAVQVDARHAAITTVLSDIELRMRSCSRWPDRKGCGQECMLQIQIAPFDSSFKDSFARWYAGRNGEWS
jgi:hypothetical protein